MHKTKKKNMGGKQQHFLLTMVLLFCICQHASSGGALSISTGDSGLKAAWQGWQP